jgi:hypothetical protein
MREICTSGSVRGGEGNLPAYSAIDLDHMTARGFVEMVIYGVRVGYEISLIT